MKALRSRRTTPGRKASPTKLDGDAPAIDVRALRGPNGKLDGDARALTLCAPQNVNEMQHFLSVFEKNNDAAERRKLAVALWPTVRRLFDHRVEMNLRETARDNHDLVERMQPANLIKVLDEALAFYGQRKQYDAIWEPLEQARRALRKLRGSVLPPWVPTSGGRRAKRGNPQTGRVPEARRALDPFLDEDEQREPLILVGLLPRQ